MILSLPPIQSSFIYHRVHWRVELIPSPEYGFPMGARILRNGRVEWKATGGEFSARRVRTPAPFPVFFVREHSYAGHGETTRLFGIVRDRPVEMIAVQGEARGPVFRDLDGDGTREWIWDDYDWYEHWERKPLHWREYKLDKSGRLVLWRTEPARGRPLPRSFGGD